MDLRNNKYDYSNEEISLIENKLLENHYKYGLGVCLSKEMHYLYHHEYGSIDIIPEKFEEFYNKYLILQEEKRTDKN